MKIVDVREMAVGIKSEIRNSYIDFSQMTVSVLALVTDVVRDGRPVVGFGERRSHARRGWGQKASDQEAF